MRRILLTPGPLTTSEGTRRAMQADWGSRETDFLALTADLRRRLLSIAKGEAHHVAVPLQGSGTFIVEAAIATLIKPDQKLLVLVNGAYGERMVAIARRYRLPVEAMTWPEDQAVQPDIVGKALALDPDVTHVAMVHCETTTGLLNPLAAVADVVCKAGRRFLVDAMSSFGALPLDLSAIPITAVVASSNKCLEGVPGLGFALIDRTVLQASESVSPSVSLDLYDQWRGLERNGQWRFTPPVQVVAALVEALHQLEDEGGPSARLQRYQANFAVLSQGMTALGYRLFLEPSLQAPIISTFRPPHGAIFDFDRFHSALADRGFVIYPGKLTKEESFRIGCIGAVTPQDFQRLISAVSQITPDLLTPAGTARDAALAGGSKSGSKPRRKKPSRLG